MSRWLLLAFVPGCIFVFKDPPCTDLLAVSVTVTVEDDSGVVIPDARVTYRVDDGPVQACDAWGGDGSFACGFEESGAFTVRVEADGYTPFEDSFTVARDECHVIGRAITASLIPMDCTLDIRNSVVATVVGASDEALEDVAVTWRSGEDGPEHPCDAMGDVWWCAEEVAGDLTITASAAGHTTASETVTVTEDACHVITEAVTLTLDWLPD